SAMDGTSATALPSVADTAGTRSSGTAPRNVSVRCIVSGSAHRPSARGARVRSVAITRPIAARTSGGTSIAMKQRTAPRNTVVFGPTDAPHAGRATCRQMTRMMLMRRGSLLAVAVLGVCGCRNVETPAGYVGYVTQGAFVGKARFYDLQSGPTSSGLGWLLSVVNVSVTPYTYSEEFNGESAVLSRDNLQVAFRVHVLWKVRPDRIRDFVEHYSTLGAGKQSEDVVAVAYRNFLREPLRTFARDEVQRLNGLEIKDRITEVGDAITKRVGALTAETPFQVMSVVVGNIQYPETVAQAVAEKMAATQVLERKHTEIEIEQREAEKRVVQADGIAKAMAIINERLSAQYLQHEAIEAQKAMVGSQNHTTIYLPVGPLGV